MYMLTMTRERSLHAANCHSHGNKQRSEAVGRRSR